MIRLNGVLTTMSYLYNLLYEQCENQSDINKFNDRWKRFKSNWDSGSEDTFGRVSITGLNGHRYTVDPGIEDDFDWLIHHWCAVVEMTDYRTPEHIILSETLDELMLKYARQERDIVI